MIADGWFFRQLDDRICEVAHWSGGLLGAKRRCSVRQRLAAPRRFGTYSGVVDGRPAYVLLPRNHADPSTTCDRCTARSTVAVSARRRTCGRATRGDTDATCAATPKTAWGPRRATGAIHREFRGRISGQVICAGVRCGASA